MLGTVRKWLVRVMAGMAPAGVRDGDRGWGLLSDWPKERGWGEVQALYDDTIEAWRKNPLAKRSVDITSDFVVGDGIRISSTFGPLQRYIEAFWSHRKNLMDLRLETMCNELTLSGDLFPVLFTNPFDGLSVIRFVTKDRIQKVITAENDWETELVFVEAPSMAAGDVRPREWLGAENAAAGPEAPVMLHYAVNRILGALMGEGDLATMIPWLLRYSRLLEDRVRLHAAVRSFLWFVTVPTTKVSEKGGQYATPPPPGSVVVKDEEEVWEVLAPNLNGADAAHDLEAVRRMIFSGSGFPPHWFGERGSNRAEATAMQSPAERHLLRRQRYFVHLLQDIVYHGYRRAQLVAPSLPRLPAVGYEELFGASVPDVSRGDNAELAQAAQRLTDVWRGLVLEAEPKSRTLTALLLSQVFRFMGEPQPAQTISKITDEIFSAVERGAATGLTVPGGDADRGSEKGEGDAL